MFLFELFSLWYMLPILWSGPRQRMGAAFDGRAVIIEDRHAYGATEMPLTPGADVLSVEILHS